MMTPQTIARLAAIILLSATLFVSGCQSQTPDFSRNVSYLENTLIDAINQNGPGDRYVINRVNVSEQVVDWFTISLTQGNPFSASSESGAGTVGAGSVVQFCGWGEFLGLAIFTEYPYLCRRGEGLVFGVTQYGWVHLYGSGEVD